MLKKQAKSTFSVGLSQMIKISWLMMEGILMNDKWASRWFSIAYLFFIGAS
jgi:hypothetical protein